MNKIQRTISYDDLNSFLPDNLTALNKNHWNKSLCGITDGYPELLEALSRVEYNDEHIKQIENKIKNNALEFNERIEKELLDRKNEISDDDEINQLNNEIKNITLVYNDK